LEHWQQESAPAILKRLLVASMAAAVVWRLQRNTSPEAEELKKVLTQLSGKSRKRNKPQGYCFRDYLCYYRYLIIWIPEEAT
jgi:hypothetical protein